MVERIFTRKYLYGIARIESFYAIKSLFIDTGMEFCHCEQLLRHVPFIMTLTQV